MNNDQARLVSTDNLRFALAQPEPGLHLSGQLLDRCPPLSIHVLLPQPPTIDLEPDGDAPDRWLLARLHLDVDEDHPHVIVVAIQQSVLWTFMPLEDAAHRLGQLLRRATTFLADSLVAGAETVLAEVTRELSPATPETTPATETAGGAE